MAASGTADAREQRLTHDSAVSDALNWLESHTAWPAGEARRRVRARLRALDEANLQRIARTRGGVSQVQAANALRSYYEIDDKSPFRFYSAQCNGVRRTTSVLSQVQWLGLGLPLGQSKDQWTVDTAIKSTPGKFFLTGAAADAAVARIAETLVLETRFVNAPLYR